MRPRPAPPLRPPWRLARHGTWALAAALLLPLLAACASRVTAGADVLLPAGAQPLTPPAEYALWWRMVESCSGLSGDMNAIAWYQVPNSATIPVEGADVGGYWASTGNVIVLAGLADEDGGLVRHEMLHALLRVGGHPRAQFLGRCGGIVICQLSCLRDAGPAPTVPAGTPIVPASALVLAATTLPAAPAVSDYEAHFVVLVTATNPASHPVVVSLPPAGDGGPPRTFHMRVSGGPYAYADEARAYDAGVAYFAAGETKRQAFDALGGTSTFFSLPAGTYRLTVGFGDDSVTEAAPVTIGP